MDGVYISFGLFIVLFIITAAAVITALLLFRKMRIIKLKLNYILVTLDDIAQGNSNQKILAKPNDMTSEICYKINEIVHDFRGQVTDLKKAEKANKQLMTSLSHDVRTPLTTLIGYLDIGAYSRIINNLIQNVVSHSRTTHIKISIFLLNKYIRITVADNGDGISKQDLPHIFERLYKCDKARSEKGSGLGLFIVQQLVIKMGGMITVESEPGKQTEFVVQFPLADESPC